MKIYLDPTQPSEVNVVVRIRPIEVEEQLSGKGRCGKPRLR